MEDGGRRRGKGGEWWPWKKNIAGLFFFPPPRFFFFFFFRVNFHRETIFDIWTERNGRLKINNEYQQRRGQWRFITRN